MLRRALEIPPIAVTDPDAEPILVEGACTLKPYQFGLP
jgi:hypothetical protein